MANYIKITENPQYKAVEIFIVMRDFRKGGLNLDNYEEFIMLSTQNPTQITAAGIYFILKLLTFQIVSKPT
jgi:hypothetical protein